MEQQDEQRGHQQEIGMECRVRENREIVDEERTRKRNCRVIDWEILGVRHKGASFLITG